MKIILVLINILAYLGAILSMYNYRSQLEAIEILAMIFVVILNLICAYYLYKKAQQNKTEWALLGFAGNINALLVYWFWSYIISKWGKGEKLIKSGENLQ